MARTDRRAGAQWSKCEAVLSGTQGIGAHLFYYWRKRLREQQQPMRFALVERGPRQEPASEASLELVLVSGERLRIGAGVDAITLRVVVAALRT